MSDLTVPDSSGAAPAKALTHHSESKHVDSKQVAAFFEIAGKRENIPARTKIFIEERRVRTRKHTEERRVSTAPESDARMYFLQSGEVALTRNRRALDLVMPGELFGVTALIMESSNLATAATIKDSVVVSLNTKQFLDSLQQMPEFALSLIGAQAQRLQRSQTRLVKAGPSSLPPLVSEGALDAKAIDQLRHALGDPMATRIEAGGKVIAQGAVALFMYVLTEGRVAIMVGDRVVEYVGPGAVFGELALVGGASRAATAVAEENSAWYPVGRAELLHVVKSNPTLGVALLRSLSKRIQHVGYLLSEAPAALAAIHLPRLNPNTAKGPLGSLQMVYNRNAKTFLAESAAYPAALETTLKIDDRTGFRTIASKLKELATKIGAERVMFHANALEQACAAGDLATIQAILPSLRTELDDTGDELRDYMKER